MPRLILISTPARLAAAIILSASAGPLVSFRGDDSEGTTTTATATTAATDSTADTIATTGSTDATTNSPTGGTTASPTEGTTSAATGTSDPTDSGGNSTGSITCPNDRCGETTGDSTSAGDPCQGAPGCGDGVRDYECEECDLGPANSDDGECTSLCRAAVCGDGLLHIGVEQCDDGDDDPNDGCPDHCGNAFSYTPPRLVAGSYHMCALSGAGKVRCWGGSDYKHGQLGYESTQQVGNDPGEMPPPDVDVGGEVVQITAGAAHTCALLASGKVRCWGEGSSGALGSGSTQHIGDGPGEMPPPDVDVGGDAVQIAAGEFNTCALLASGVVRCWGAHSPNNIGDDPGEMPPPDVPVTGAIVQLHANRDQSCVLRADGTASCWRTDHVPYGAWFGGFIVELSGSLCARLAGGAIRCIGYNDYGQKGYGHTSYVGDAITAGDIAVGGAVTRLSPGDAHTCAILAAGNVRGWGDNSFGALGYGHTDNLGDEPGEMPTPDLELGGPALEVAVTPMYGCAIVTGGAVRCWGYGKDGNLGYGNYQTIGDQPGEMPPPVVPVF